MYEKKLKISKPIHDLSNINTRFVDRMKHYDDEKNGKLNLVIIKEKKITNNSILKKSKTKKINKN